MTDAHLVACVLCGGDAATEAMIVNAAVAGGLSVPIYFRRQAAELFGKVRGRARRTPATFESPPPTGGEQEDED